jgi:PAS domain-containing protein
MRRNMNNSMRDWLGVQNDITEHGRAADVARWNEQRYRTLFDLGPVAVYSCDASGVIHEFNRRAAELWGCEPAVGDIDKRFCGSFKLFRPDGHFMPHDECDGRGCRWHTVGGARRRSAH